MKNKPKPARNKHKNKAGDIPISPSALEKRCPPQAAAVHNTVKPSYFKYETAIYLEMPNCAAISAPVMFCVSLEKS